VSLSFLVHYGSCWNPCLCFQGLKNGLMILDSQFARNPLRTKFIANVQEISMMGV
jgi:hypothetical protein